MARAPIKPVPVITPQDYVRFEAAFVKNAASGCWEWQRTIVGRGYGQFFAQGRTFFAHRVSWVYANKRDIPSGLLICHKCDNPKCVNPEHLEIGDHRKNMRDSVERGRRPKHRPYEGKLTSAKLSKAQMTEIGTSNEPSEMLAKRYGICAGRCNELKRKFGREQRRSIKKGYVRTGRETAPDRLDMVLDAITSAPKSISELSDALPFKADEYANKCTISSLVWRLKKYGLAEKVDGAYRAVG